MDRRTVVITGGSSGIGRACALKFAGEGASVYELRNMLYSVGMEVTSTK